MRVMNCAHCSLTTTGGHEPHCPYYVQTIQPFESFELNALPTIESQVVSLQQLLQEKHERIAKLERILGRIANHKDILPPHLAAEVAAALAPPVEEDAR